jgi:glycosyltransferase involved in cell wall biosynthesis
MKISVIIPCYNEEQVLENTYSCLNNVLESYCTVKQYSYEMIFVDDGSVDHTESILESIADLDKHVKFISFSRNFGKESGMLAGLEASDGDVSIIMDSDLQHPPELIPKMVECYLQGYDQVICKRTRKGEGFIRKNLTRLYYKLVNNLIDVPLYDGVGDFRLLSRRAKESLLSLTEYNRFSKGLFSFIGYDKTYINYENVERTEGSSKWNLKSLFNYGIEGIISFNNKPLRLIIHIGLIILGISMLYIFVTLIDTIVNGISSKGYFTLISAILLIGSIQLISIGVVGEYIGRIYYEAKKRPHYIIKHTNINHTNIAKKDITNTNHMTFNNLKELYFWKYQQDYCKYNSNMSTVKQYEDKSKEYKNEYNEYKESNEYENKYKKLKEYENKYKKTKEKEEDFLEVAVTSKEKNFCKEKEINSLDLKCKEFVEEKEIDSFDLKEKTFFEGNK